MPGLMAASDIVIQNAGGLTCLEALAAGRTVVSHGCLPGHGEANAEAMARGGIAVHACGSDLSTAITAAVSDEVGRARERAVVTAMFGQDDMADLTARAASSALPAKARRRRRVVLSAAAVAAGVVVSGGAILGLHGTSTVGWTKTLHAEMDHGPGARPLRRLDHERQRTVRAAKVWWSHHDLDLPGDLTPMTRTHRIDTGIVDVGHR